MDYIKGFNFGRGVKADIYCRSRDTRNGFAHDCVIPKFGIKETRHYLNRTWESFDFESTIHGAFDKYVDSELALKGKKNEVAHDREYKKLCKRLTAWYHKGKIRFMRDPKAIFA